MLRRRFLAFSLALSLVLVGGFAVAATGIFATVQCDGSVPEWMIPADYDGSGCVMLRPSWEERLPWNAGRTASVCLGMCIGEEPYSR